MIPSAVSTWLAEQGYRDVENSRPVGGGCINNGVALQTTSGKSFFLKTNPHAPSEMFEREAEGLTALNQPDAPRIPQVYLVGSDFLLLEDLNPTKPAKDYWASFGQQLARLHLKTHPQFGFDSDNYIGSTPQINFWTEDGYEFFGQHRLLYQAKLAKSNRYFDGKELRKTEAFIKRLPDLVPAQLASLIHGDLWKGNAISDENGQPALIDPATHYGWAEAEMAMTALFGGFPSEFYAAYEDGNPLEPGWRERFPIYNLYHLLNHLNLFGMGYHLQVISILNQYT
ncbi:MAG: hypothetical protein DWQ07_05850 [Chloroflexi bacterium]|nr:MAG: hypothetical protein DWQ07_05850 [Chloroflexota bacterium]MBL1196692.1 hypothetical protein [Chloroflexota bacterium]NOH13985.1 phosphotransferase [Chloroflexota bacterium]